jgi:hypothetical protein
MKISFEQESGSVAEFSATRDLWIGAGTPADYFTG